ncbi:MAG: hypothetical protein AB7G62_01225 [Magnetospirillum sp.]
MTIKKGAFRPASAMDKRRAAPVVGGRDAPKNRKRFASRPAGFGSYPARPPIHAFAPLISRRGKGAPLISDAALIQMEDVTMNVRVSEFREEIDHLYRLIKVDYCACVGERERAYWAEITHRVLARVEALKCARAKAEDWQSHARCLAAAKKRLADFPVPSLSGEG